MKTKKAYNTPEIQVVVMKAYRAMLAGVSPAGWPGEVGAHPLEDDIDDWSTE